MRWRRFVAVGDSFTEGMDDPYPDGSYRGWADLVATTLAAATGPEFGYANLAIRGRLFQAVVAQQVPAAMEMAPDLVSFAAGGNDVLLFRFAELMARLPGQRLVAPRVSVLNLAVAETAGRHGAMLVDRRGPGRPTGGAGGDRAEMRRGPVRAVRPGGGTVIAGHGARSAWTDRRT